LYVEGPDFYYSHPDGEPTSFGRYRRPSFGLDGGRAEWTVKFKPKGAKNSIQRLELNWRVDKTPEEDIKRGALLMGFTPNFTITKSCQIYKFEDATLVFYTVYDITEGSTSSKVDHFVEIEVSEEKINKEGLTEVQAWAIIEKYEKTLAPIGITPQKRLRKSLWEMYRR
jgi:adenylate cyclase class IV